MDMEIWVFRRQPKDKCQLRILPRETGLNAQDTNQDNDGGPDGNGPLAVSLLQSSEEDKLRTYEQRLNVNSPFFPAPVENGTIMMEVKRLYIRRIGW